MAMTASKPLLDPFTARAMRNICAVIGSGGALLGAHALLTGCIRTRHKGHVQIATHCAPQVAYWIPTAVACIIAVILLTLAWKLHRYARAHVSDKPTS